MRLSRKQKRWLRQHRGIVNLAKIFVFLLVIGIIYLIISSVNSNLRISNIFRSNKGELVENESSAGGNTATTPSTGKKDKNEPQYVSQLVELNDRIVLSEVEQAALNYVPDPSKKKPYMIRVNRVANCVTVYGLDSSGFYSIPVKAMACSTGRNEGDTPTGSGSITDKYTFHLMVDGTYGQYAVRFMSGGILFHSVPYYKQDKSQLETDQFNKLGEVASLGCVRLCVRDALWIYENCPQGTDVVVYDDATNPGPLGKPEMIKIPENSQFGGWDPTDPDPSNPWKQYQAMIVGANDVTVNVGDLYNPRNNVKAIDTCGNDISHKLLLTGSYDLGIPGIYTVNYSVTDAIGSTATATITITVVDPTRN